jgi:hypothetical protein
MEVWKELLGWEAEREREEVGDGIHSTPKPRGIHSLRRRTKETPRKPATTLGESILHSGIGICTMRTPKSNPDTRRAKRIERFDGAKHEGADRVSGLLTEGTCKPMGKLDRRRHSRGIAA